MVKFAFVRPSHEFIPSTSTRAALLLLAKSVYRLGIFSNQCWLLPSWRTVWLGRKRLVPLICFRSLWRL